MAVSLELFDRFWRCNFWVKAYDVNFYPSLTADPYNRRTTGSCGQHCTDLLHYRKLNLTHHNITVTVRGIATIYSALCDHT